MIHAVCDLLLPLSAVTLLVGNGNSIISGYTRFNFLEYKNIYKPELDFSRYWLRYVAGTGAGTRQCDKHFITLHSCHNAVMPEIRVLLCH